MSHFDRIFIVDPNSRRRAHLARASYEIGIHAEPCQDLAEFADVARSDGVVLCPNDRRDICMEDVMEVASHSGHCLPTIVYSEEPTPQQIVDAMLRGALSYHVWPLDADAIKKALQMTPAQVNVTNLRLKQEAAKLAIVDLSPRELQVLQNVTKGHSNKEIARQLEISPRTVEIHRAKMLEKLKVSSSLDAVRIGVYAGLD